MPRDTRRRQPDEDHPANSNSNSKKLEDSFDQRANHCPDKPGRPCGMGDHKFQYQEYLRLLKSRNILFPSQLQEVLKGTSAYSIALRDQLESTSGFLDKAQHFGLIGPSAIPKQGDSQPDTVASGKTKHRDTPDVGRSEISRIQKQRAERKRRNDQSEDRS